MKTVSFPPRRYHLQANGFTVVFLLLIGLFTLCRPGEGDESEAPSSPHELSLDIVPTPIQAQHGQRTLFPGAVFYVVMTNISVKPVNIYEDWSSTGFYTLSFEAKSVNGKTYNLQKGGVHSWTRNFPALFTIPPGGHYVFAVHFDADQWPMLDEMHKTMKPSDMRFQFKAIFDENSKDAKVWSGHVESKPELLAIFPM